MSKLCCIKHVACFWRTPGAKLPKDLLLENNPTCEKSNSKEGPFSVSLLKSLLNDGKPYWVVFHLLLRPISTATFGLTSHSVFCLQELSCRKLLNPQGKPTAMPSLSCFPTYSATAAAWLLSLLPLTQLTKPQPARLPALLDLTEPPPNISLHPDQVKRLKVLQPVGATAKQWRRLVSLAVQCIASLRSF